MHHRTVAIALALPAEVKETAGDDGGVYSQLFHFEPYIYIYHF